MLLCCQCVQFEHCSHFAPLSDFACCALISSLAPSHITPCSKTAKTSTTKKSPYKKFTHQQVKDKVDKRKNGIPEYHSLLMASAVREDAEGIVFDSTHPSWKALVKLVNAVDAAEKNEKKGAQPGAQAAQSQTTAQAQAGKHQPQPPKTQPPAHLVKAAAAAPAKLPLPGSAPAKSQAATSAAAAKKPQPPPQLGKSTFLCVCWFNALCSVLTRWCVVIRG